MEELQSTEILDREILEDARRKACRILKAADDAVKAQAGEWEQKSAAALDGLRKNNARRRGLAAAEIMARLPLDKRRAKAEKIESLLRRAAETWYEGMSREQALAVLKTELARRVAACDELKGMKAYIHKLERREAESILQAVLPGALEIAEGPSSALYPEIVLENNAVRITVSIQKTVDFFLHEKRAELAEALLGKAALSGEDAL